jgi:hypothetical protein
MTLTLTLSHSPPISKSIFVEMESLLEDTEYQKALRWVAGRKDMDRYRSIGDFLFSELMGGKWKRACFLYYEGDGCLLKDDPRVTKEMIVEWDQQICLALKTAHSDMDEERTRSWTDFRRRWKNKLAA